MNYKGTAHKVGEHIDTDAIIPARFLVTSDAKELGANCMAGLEPDWVKRVKPGDIVVADENFGCGSSREHAPWALLEYGFRCVIAPSFADIFKNNALGNGLLPVELKQSEIDALFKKLESEKGTEVTVDLEKETVTAGDLHYSFKVDPFRRWMMLEGLDAIGLTLKDEDKIAAYEATMPAWRAKPLG